MFKTEKYRIRFERLPIDNESSKAGRYHTGCEIYVFYDGTETHKVPLYIGIAHLHPKDVPDKIIGKKEALKRALIKRKVMKLPGEVRLKKIIWRLPKIERTMIWAAFWLWTQSWEKAKICKTCVYFGETKQFCFCKDGGMFSVTKDNSCDHWRQR